MKKIGLTQKLTLWRTDLIVSTLLYNLLIGAGVFVCVEFLTNILPSSVRDTFIYSGLICGIISVGGMVYIARQKILNWIVRQNFYRSVLSIFADYSQPSLSSLRQMDPPSNSHVIFLHTLFVDLIRVPISLVLIAFISTNLAAVLSVLILILFSISVYQGSKIIETHQSKAIQNNQMSLVQQECLKNYQTIKMLAMENLMLRRYEKICYSKAFTTNTSNLIGLTTQDFYSIWQTVSLVSMILVLSNEYLTTAIALDQLMASLLLVAYALMPVQALLNHWDDLMAYRLSIKNQPIKNEKKLEKNSVIELDGSINIESVDYAYPGSQTQILAAANLKILPKKLVTIYGQSGSGKTTLAKLIQRTLIPDQGKISFSDKDFDIISMTSFRQQVMYLSSDPQLYIGTILENLTFFKIGPLVDEAIKLSQQLGLDKWVQTQPLGYQTPIFDSMDTSIPSGIKQRIGLIRAFLQEPKILILDEANSYLDEPGDKALRSILADMKEGMTILFITHRPSLKNIADESYDLVNGQLLPSMNVDTVKPMFYTSALMSALAGDA